MVALAVHDARQKMGVGDSIASTETCGVVLLAVAFVLPDLIECKYPRLPIADAGALATRVKNTGLSKTPDFGKKSGRREKR